MTAEILEFKPGCISRPPCDVFQKALAAVAILMDFSAPEAFEIIAQWVASGLVSDTEGDALRAFCERTG